MESSGVRDNIQCTSETVDLLRACGKDHWIHPREEMIRVVGKGKKLQLDGKSVTSTGIVLTYLLFYYFEFQGLVQTYWIKADVNESVLPGSSESMPDGDMTEASDFDNLIEDLSVRSTNTKRLVEWNVDLLQSLLKQMIARRESTNVDSNTNDGTSTIDRGSWMEESYSYEKLPLEEIQDVIEFPAFDPTEALPHEDLVDVPLDAAVLNQLRDYITNIALL